MFSFYYKKTAISLILILTISCSSSYLFGQNQKNKAVYYNTFDSIVGIGNTGLYNGIEFEDTFRILKNKHQYLLSEEFSVGTVFYDGQPYYDVSMKYDVWNDDVIVKLPTEFNFDILRLIRGKVDEFTFHDRYFINTEFENSNKRWAALGIIEILYEGDHFTAVKKHKKIKKQKLDREVYTYFDEDNRHFLIYQRKVYMIKSRKDFLKIIPEYSKEIKNLIKKGRAIRKSDYPKFLIYMAKNIDNLVSDKTTSK